MKCISLEQPLDENEQIEIIYIDFNIEKLIITVLIDGDKLDVSFEEPAGYRVLDEGDLLEFWPCCSSSNGWMHEIISGGWYDQESKRKGFASSNGTEVKEYFIIGCNYCANILAWEPPSVCESIR